MKQVCLDREWTFRRGFLDSLGGLEADPGVVVNLPHDGMISLEVREDAPAGNDSGYYPGDMSNYTKYVEIPAEWAGDCVGLKFDGAMMHTTVDVNGARAGEHHNGYAPFYVDITQLVTFGEKNRITINTNAGVQSSSRWYSGCGLFRGVTLCHASRVHVANDGIYVWTREVADGYAFLEAEVDVCNETLENRIVEVGLELRPDAGRRAKVVSAPGANGSSETGAVVSHTAKRIQVNAGSRATARLQLIVEKPEIWDVDHPFLYQATATVKNLGEYRTHLIPAKAAKPGATAAQADGDLAGGESLSDTQSVLFGIRTITVDAVRGLRVNGRTVKLKGGCLHHDNGIVGAISLYEFEARKVRKLKEIGFNAIRTTHNPPSAALVEACDRLGMYIFDEAFDAWGMGKRPGDFNTHFASDWKLVLEAFVRRDRVHPSVIIWSTGNEIPERGGLNNGYTLAAELAQAIRSLDATRPVSNGICSLWAGLDDQMAKGMDQSQNANDTSGTDLWEHVTEPFAAALDIVGCNYLEDQYERDHELYPERVILGSENFPREIGFRWPFVESHAYVIGDFTWTAWDYIGESGIGKALHLDPSDPRVNDGPWTIMPPTTTYFPWRTANDADVDITGRLLPQGAYRSVVWGSNATHVYAQRPEWFGTVERTSMWGFPEVEKNWNFPAYDGKPIQLLAFTSAEEAALVIDGREVERKAVSKDRPLPNSVYFENVYHSGKVEVVSYTDGVEVSRDAMESTGEAVAIRLVPEERDVEGANATSGATSGDFGVGTDSGVAVYRADGHDVAIVSIEIVDASGAVVTDAEVKVQVELASVKSASGKAISAGEVGAAGADAAGDAAAGGAVCTLSAVGTGRSITGENYTDPTTITYRGEATAIVRSGYEAGEATLTVHAEGLPKASVTLMFS